MHIDEAKQRFIQAWGTLGAEWGINRTMSQIHALLLVTVAPMTTEDIMEALQISRGNANMNLRQLLDWKLLKKELVMGERKEYFVAIKDIPYVARQIIHERRQKELAPILTALQEVSQVKEGNPEAIAGFKAVVHDIKTLTESIDALAQKFENTDYQWFMKILLYILGKK